MRITLCDESMRGDVTNQLTLDLLDESMSVRELIRARVYQEVDEHNRRTRVANSEGVAFNGLVTPSMEERQLNGKRPGTVRNKEIDWKKQFTAACDAFERNGFFILIDNRQAETLDEMVLLRAGSKISFVKLTPLVGG